MKVLIACEESQEACKAFRTRGHEAYSCDLQEPSGGHPEWHIWGDAVAALEGGAGRNDGWRDAQRRKMGFTYSPSTLYLPQQRRSAASVERSRAASRPGDERDSGPRFVYAFLVGEYPENLRREPYPEQGFLPAALHADDTALSIRTSVLKENVSLAEKSPASLSDGRCGASSNVVSVWRAFRRPKGIWSGDVYRRPGKNEVEDIPGRRCGNVGAVGRFAAAIGLKITRG